MQSLLPSEVACFKEQRIYIKFCFYPEKVASAAYEVPKKKTFEWYLGCKGGQISVENFKRSGLPLSSHTDKNVENCFKS
jgi:hypothetical protein